ncbi:MAG: alpha-L-fucosidase [Bacteroides sp.]|nr:alpha-L-fucosidase [Bacteroides sp.]
MAIFKNMGFIISMASLLVCQVALGQDQQRTDQTWGGREAPLKQAEAHRGELFKQGNYAMFIHWGLYSQIANQYQDSTYYGIAEWIMNPRRADIPVEEYKAITKDFNPVNFDAEAIVSLAKSAGMKYIIITSKHHDGFAMYDSKVSDFNIVDATPFGRDPMKELAKACKKEGLGFGFYYSQNQDWTAPGGNGGPAYNSKGDSITFDEYFHNKCLPQVDEITTRYGDIVLIWFDTPAGMPKDYAEMLIDLVHKNQSDALVSGRIGYGLGDYQTLGDMEIPHENVDGLWEAVDVTNDSWGYAWYDKNWKSPESILERLISTVARGGTYMLNVGPKADGSIPEHAVRSLKSSGEWIATYPQVVYDAGPSPWQHALPWGDVTRQNNSLYLSVYQWPEDGMLYLPGLKNEISTMHLLKGDSKTELAYSRTEQCVEIKLPLAEPEDFVSVIELELIGEPDVNQIHALDPHMSSEITAHFADTLKCRTQRKRWMEKFGEWKQVYNIHQWDPGSKATWEINVIEPGAYEVELTYAGSGRLVWSVESDEGDKVQNQQNSSHIFNSYPIGWMNFETAGLHKVSVSLVEGDPMQSELAAIKFTPIDFGNEPETSASTE